MFFSLLYFLLNSKNNSNSIILKNIRLIFPYYLLIVDKQWRMLWPKLYYILWSCKFTHIVYKLRCHSLKIISILLVPPFSPTFHTNIKFIFTFSLRIIHHLILMMIIPIFYILWLIINYGSDVNFTYAIVFIFWI